MTIVNHPQFSQMLISHMLDFHEPGELDDNFQSSPIFSNVDSLSPPSKTTRKKQRREPKINYPSSRAQRTDRQWTILHQALQEDELEKALEAHSEATAKGDTSLFPP